MILQASSYKVKGIDLSKWDDVVHWDILKKEVKFVILRAGIGQGGKDSVYEKYYKKFVRIISTLEKVDEKKHQITIGYQDEGKKYSLIIKCDVVKEQKNIKKLETGKEITIIGTVKSFKPATKKNANTIYISNCFAEQ